MITKAKAATSLTQGNRYLEGMAGLVRVAGIETERLADEEACHLPTTPSTIARMILALTLPQADRRELSPILDCRGVRLSIQALRRMTGWSSLPGIKTSPEVS